jgi:hypothetical protein
LAVKVIAEVSPIRRKFWRRVTDFMVGIQGEGIKQTFPLEVNPIPFLIKPLGGAGLFRRDFGPNGGGGTVRGNLGSHKSPSLNCSDGLPGAFEALGA